MNPKPLYRLYTCIVLCFVIMTYSAPPPTQKTNSKPAGHKLAILMYHGFTQGGRESEYVIDISRFEQDVVYLIKNGYEFVDTQDLIQYTESKKTLPEKCVMITMDDGYLNNYTYAYPILKKYGIKAVISPIAYYVEYYTIHNEPNPLYAQLSYKEIKEMHESKLVDFQNHSYNMHSLDNRKGSSKLEKENSEEYIREFYYDLKAAENILKEITGKKTTAYVYPFGSISSESKSILKCCGYKLSLSCAEGFNYITNDPDSLYMLRRFNRTPQKSAEHFLLRY